MGMYFAVPELSELALPLQIDALGVLRKKLSYICYYVVHILGRYGANLALRVNVQLI
jgi:hypothetical protein